MLVESGIAAELDDCIDKGRVIYIGGAVPLGPAPREGGGTTKGGAPLV
jgi:hypothetical protein